MRDRVALLAHIGFLVCALCAALSASVAHSGACGDDVGGTRVACGCGDFVISDTHLVSDDPVVTERCMSDGLIVDAAADSEGIVVDLGGLSIVGSGIGYGIVVIDGGIRGADVIGGPDSNRPGQVAGFGSGMKARGQRSIRLIRNLDLRGNVRDGLVQCGSSSLIESVGAYDNGRDGIRLGGRGPSVIDLHADGNRRHGIHPETRPALDRARAAGLISEQSGAE